MSTCDICGHPEASHAWPPGIVLSPKRGLQRPCRCGRCNDFAPFQGYFGPAPTIEQESA